MARQSEVKAHTEELSRHFKASGVTVEDTADSLTVLAKDIQRVAMSLAVVNDDRHVELDGKLHHVDEDGLLDVTFRFRPMIV